ncbi:MAG: RNA-splicing ligase RtcB [Nanohaloarchaea archaeon SW_7_43_1]|nr:MAG: RNA-splicing ligase RtcB [Nanohaloarchaea archaeon SW_7_43_1]
MELSKVSENIYEIPKDGEMNVPTRVYASEELLEEMRNDDTLEQVKNMASLPGIQKYSIVMPDGHQGYGFPIGGVAAFDAEKGIISPGAIGFDINCLTGDSKVLTEFGRSKKVEKLKNNFDNEKAVVATGDESVGSDIQLFTEKKDRKVFEIETETGETVKATKDHPFLTEDGMKELSELSEGERVFMGPFKGIEDEELEEFALLTGEDFKEENDQLVEALLERDLLPLKSNDEEFNILLKLIGFHTGDGTFNNSGETRFYADREDLKAIQEDIRELGFKPSKIYSRDRTHQVRQEPFEVTEKSMKATSRAFQKLMIKLGTPKGKKTRKEFALPEYFDQLAKWQKALYLSTFFGAEMSKPKAQHDKNLYCPKISQNKSTIVKESGRKFLEGIKQALQELGIKTNRIEEFETHENKDGKVTRLRLGVKNDSDNLINFFQKVGYRYNREKKKESIKAIQYLKTKEKAIQRREEIAKESVLLYENGTAPKEIKQRFDINNRFIERSIYNGRKTSSRPPENFPDYEEYAKDLKVENDFTVKTSIKSIEPAGREKVYDIGVKHEAHNFQANQFIVSNCGVRVLKTDLNAEDIDGKEQQLANIMYSKIPVGLGKGGYLNTDKEDLREILDNGMEWMLENGHAHEEDLRRCEENGKLPGDHRKVPDDAIKRGLNQVGSLGSGNHFMEVQVVGEIFNEEKAEAYGLEANQVVIMIHSGSRGLGHETCTKYLRRFEKEYPEIAEAIPEKNLIYAPIEDVPAQDYKKAMYAAANYAWANRQALTQGIRECISTIFDEEVETELLYDVCHNIAKEETHEVEGKEKEVIVHRKGATRAMPAGREEVPEVYSEVGQPVLIPGSMGTSSYILSGGDNSLEISFGSTAHGAGRLKSRTQAKQDYWGEDIQKELEREGILVKADSGSTVAEEAPGVYKDIDEVIQVSDELGIGEKVVKILPVVNIKG